MRLLFLSNKVGKNNEKNQLLIENKENIKFKSNLKDVLIYFLFFLIIPFLGTQLHEIGHYIAALALGCNPTIHYAYCNHGCDIIFENEYFIFITAAPLATWIESLAGFTTLLFYRKRNRDSIKNGQVSFMYLILLGFTSFCARFVFNAIGYFFSGNTGLDEWKMENYLNITHGIIIYGFAILGAIILLYNLIILPKMQRYKLLIGGLLGAIIGYISWYSWLGPIFMP